MEIHFTGVSFIDISRIEFLFLWYFAGINLFYSLFLIIGSVTILSRKQELAVEDVRPILYSNSLPEMMFIIPMYNESKNILPNIHNLFNLSYRYKRVIAVNDGSTDDTLAMLQKDLALVPIPKYYTEALPTQHVRAVYQSTIHPEVLVIDKEHGGKFDAINAAINASPSPLFVAIDADTFLDNAGFEALIRPMLTSPQTIAIGTSVRIINGCTLDFHRITTHRFPQDILPAMQALEYLRAFLLRQGLDCFNGNFVISGAFSVFPRELIIRAGGFCSSVAEDMEIIVRLHRIMREQHLPYKIQYLPDPVAWTLGPPSLKILGKQRTRWHLGFLESLWYHKRLCFNPRYGMFGLVSLPFAVLAEAIEPIVETLAWIYVLCAWALGILHLPFFLLLIAVSLGYTFLYTIFCLLLEEFSFRKYPSLRSLFALLLSNCLENIGYRQLTVFWRLRGCWRFLKSLRKIRKDSQHIQELVKTAIGQSY